MKTEKTTHTPGPWSADTGGYPIIVNGPDNGAEDGGIICTIEDPTTPSAYTARDDERNAANARLIAAAPELLAALEDIAERADSNAQTADENSDEHGGFVRLRDEARAAIRKATGEAR